MNGESSELFWSFVDSISEISDFSTQTDEQKYQTVLSTAARSLSPAQLDLLQFSLSLRTESPKVELFSHLASDRGVDELDCPVVYEAGGQLSCDLPSSEASHQASTSPSHRPWQSRQGRRHQPEPQQSLPQDCGQQPHLRQPHLQVTIRTV